MLNIDCYNADGMLVGSQMRIIVNPIKQCSSGNDGFMPALQLGDMARLFVREHDS